MHVIVKTLTMGQIQEKHTLQRRSFFRRLFGGIVGGWLTGNLFSEMIRPKEKAHSNERIQVRIDPLAVPRMKKDEKSHGA
jgi:hypothetical protein